MSYQPNCTQEEFFRVLYADKRDIMPRIVTSWSDANGYVSEWRTTDMRAELFGRSWGNGNSFYQLADSTAASFSGGGTVNGCTCGPAGNPCLLHGRGAQHFVRSLGCGYYEVVTRADTHPSGASTPAAPRDFPNRGSLFHRCVAQLRQLEPATFAEVGR